ncbi:MAG: type II toxin-antitoxin system VapC family toxin [Acidobacteria bacterium]|nr:type II toxin-antitoxin system VapC family toxin [Acidobacteriota bacterium]
MRLLVIDASVAAKWFLPSSDEPLADEAAELLRQYARNEVGFIVPDLFWSEFANVLWKAVRQGRWTSATAHRALNEMRGRKLTTVAALSLLDEAFTLASSFDHSVYDSIYVALAVSSKAQLITADEKLANALAARLPVKWLGAF